MSKENENVNSAPTSFIGESSLEGGESASMSAPAFNLTAGSNPPPSQLQADPSAPVQMEDGEQATEPLLTDAKATSAITWDNNKEFRIDWVRNLQLELLGARTSTDGSFDDATVRAIATFQDAQELGVDGKIGTNTRRRLEQIYPSLLTTVVGENLNERVLIPAGADIQQKYNYYRGIVENAGGVFLTGAGEMNLVGIRGIEVREDGSLWQSDSAAEFAATRGPAGGTSTHLQASTAGGGAAHDDYIVSLWMVADESGNLTPEVKERQGSVDPASAYNGAERPGTAHLRDGQYAYKTGRHGTRSGSHIGAIDSIAGDEGSREQLNVTGTGGYRQYNALVPTRNQEVWRENRARGTNDLHLDAREEADSQEAIYRGDDDHINDDFAINIHTSRTNAGNSVACQNVPADQYMDFMTEINGSTNTDNILYTLIDASKIANGLVLETQTEQ
jgi:hypothetical protein